MEVEDLKKQIEAEDPYDPRLKPITDDQAVPLTVERKQKPWVVKLMGDKKDYLAENGKDTVNYGVVVVRSLQWPGAYTFYSQENQTSIYVGHGYKYELQTYFPVHPPTVLDDPEENEEQPEPTPLEEPPEEPKDDEEEGEEEGEEEN